MSLNTDIGSPYADSMVTVAEADAIVAKYYPSDTVWEGLTTAEKEILLRESADDMSDLFMLRGYKSFRGQAMPFPRKNWRSRDDIAGDDLIIPERAKDAQVLLAYEIELRNWLQRPTSLTQSTASDIGIGSLSSGGLSVSFNQTPPGSGDSFEAKIGDCRNLLKSRLRPFVTTVRMAITKRKRQYEWTASVSVSSSTTTTTTTTS